MHKNMSSSKRKRKRSEKYALLCGDCEIARGTENDMERRKRRQIDYSTKKKPIRVVPVSSLKRSREDTIDLTTTTELYEDTKRLRLHQDEEFARGLAEDRRKEREEKEEKEREEKALAKEKEREKKALAEWYERYKKPENVATLFEELFKKKFSLKLHC